MKLGQGYVFTGVCHSVNGGGVCLSTCWDTTPQEQAPHRSRHPPGTDPLEQAHPFPLPPGADTPREQAPPSGAEQAGRYGQHAGGTHPTGMQSCLFI